MQGNPSGPNPRPSFVDRGAFALTGRVENRRLKLKVPAGSEAGDPSCLNDEALGECTGI